MPTPLALARHLKCPIDSRYTGSADSATQVQPVQGSVGLEGGAGNRGYSQPVRVRPGGRLADGGCTCAVSPTRARRLSPLPVVRRCTAGAILDYLDQMLRRDRDAAAAADALQAELVGQSSGVRDPHRRRPFQRRPVGVEGRPVHRLIACAATPCGVPAAVTQAGLMPHQHFAGAEWAPVGASS